MKVFLLSGSVGKESHTRSLMHYLEDQLKAKGAETILWDLGEKPLPIAIPEYHNNQDNHPDKAVREFVKEVSNCDAFLLGSPLYHDSYSGVLKNALDSLPSEALLHKPVGVVSHSSNIRSCITPCNQLRPVVRSLGGYASQMQVGTTDQDYGMVDGKLTLVDEKVIGRLIALADEIMIMTRVINSITAAENIDFSRLLRLDVAV